MVLPHDEILLSDKKKQIIAECNRLDLKGTTLGEEKKYQSQKFAYDIIHIVFSK